jgi:uncharacterized membrane protein YqjE
VSQPGSEPALLALVRTTLDGLGALIAGHIKLARVELGRDAKAYARRLALAALLATLLLLGYGLACVAGALALARVIDAPLAFLAVGGVHLLGAGALVVALLGRAPPRPLDETLAELDRTVTTLAHDRLIPERKEANGIA